MCRLFLLALCLLGSAVPFARMDGAPAPETAEVRGLRIEPGTTGVPLGEARLSVEPLLRATGKDNLSAAYKVDITPFAFKSEEGRFSVTLSDAELHRLADGATVHFTGQAVSQDGSNTSAVEGRATPVSGRADGGELRIQVEGKKGKLVFHTTYHLIR